MGRHKAAHYAQDLTRALIERDTCQRDALNDMRARQVDRDFRKLAAALGYTLSDDVTELRAMQTDPGDEQEGAA